MRRNNGIPVRPDDPPGGRPQTMVDGNPTFTEEEIATAGGAIDAQNRTAHPVNGQPGKPQGTVPLYSIDATPATSQVGGGRLAVPAPKMPTGDEIRRSAEERSAGFVPGGHGAAHGGSDVHGYDDVERYLLEEMARVRPESKDDEAARERREKHERFLSNLGAGLGALHTAYSHARGVEPMAIPDMSARMRERFDRARAEREKNRDRFFNYYSVLMNSRRADAKEKAERAYRERKLEIEGENAENLRAYRDRMAGAREADSANHGDYWNRMAGASEQRAENERQYKEGRLSEDERHHRAMENKPSGRGGSGSRSSTKDPTQYETRSESGEEWREGADGLRYKVKTRRTYKVPRGTSGNKGGGSNIPPSRRQSSNNNNTPPSRRK